MNGRRYAAIVALRVVKLIKIGKDIRKDYTNINVKTGQAHSWWWARATLRVFNVGAGALGQLFKQKGPFYPQLLDLAFYACET